MVVTCYGRSGPAGLRFRVTVAKSCQRLLCAFPEPLIFGERLSIGLLGLFSLSGRKAPRASYITIDTNRSFENSTNPQID